MFMRVAASASIWLHCCVLVNQISPERHDQLDLDEGGLVNESPKSINTAGVFCHFQCRKPEYVYIEYSFYKFH